MGRAGGTVVAATAVVSTAALGEGGAAVLGRIVTTAVVSAAAIAALRGPIPTPTTTTAAQAPALAIGGLVELNHVGGGLLPNRVAEHLKLPLHCADGGVVGPQGFLGGGVGDDKVVDGVGEQRR